MTSRGSKGKSAVASTIRFQSPREPVWWHHYTHPGEISIKVTVLYISLPSLPSGNIHILFEGCAFRSLSCPVTFNHRLVRLYDDVQALHDEILFITFPLRPSISLPTRRILLPLAKMNLGPLSLFNGISGSNVFVTATSLLPNGNLEILEIHVFNRERMGILVSFCIKVLVLLAVSCAPNYPRFSFLLPFFP